MALVKSIMVGECFLVKQQTDGGEAIDRKALGAGAVLTVGLPSINPFL